MIDVESMVCSVHNVHDICNVVMDDEEVVPLQVNKKIVRGAVLRRIGGVGSFENNVEQDAWLA